MFKRIKELIAYLLFQIEGKKKSVDDLPTSVTDGEGDPVFLSSGEQEKKVVIIENPLKPYWKDCGDESNPHSYMFGAVARFKREGRPFNSEEYKKIFDKYVCLPNFVSEEKGPYLLKMWKDAQYLNDVLQPLSKLGIKYTLDLTGGSVRDFVLNKHDLIKDLDFMLSIEKVERRANNLLDKGIFTQEHLDAVKWDENTYESDLIKLRLLQLCLLLSKEKYTTFSHIKNRQTLISTDNYKGDIFRKDRLLGVVKMESEKTNYPVDILLTDFIKPDFVAGFDFDICKASICFVNPHVKKEFPKDYSHLISRFVADINFWADVHNNTLTYDTTDRTQIHMNSSFNNHLPRLEAKFPNSKVLFTGYGENKEYAKKLYEVKQLSEELAKKEVIEDIKPVKRVKI